MIYFIFKSLCRMSIQFFFSSIEINGKENIPAPGVPMIYTANHQSAFLDAVIIGSLTREPVYYLARADVFSGLMRYFLEAINMMPIYRMRDGYKNLSKNDQIFEKCHKILKDKKRLLIFPEGNQSIDYFLRPLTKGIARIALNTQNTIDDEIQIIPAGINYFNHLHSGHKVILNYGKPIPVSKYSELFAENNNKAYTTLLKDLSPAIKEQMLIPNDSDDYPTQKKIFNKTNEIFDFTALKSQLARNDFNSKGYSQKYLWPLKIFLMLPNLPAIGLLWFILNKVMSNQLFMASLKMAFGAIIFPLWVLISVLICGLLMDWPTAGILALVQVVCMMLLPRVNGRIRGR